jgi:hypothetical protein
MKKYTTLIAAAVLALLLAGGISLRMYMQKKQFDKTVTEALKTSEGYDRELIEMVNRLEEELATRASFGYTGGKDPMTGKIRSVVRAYLKPAVSTPGKPAEEVYVDPYKLTAIIFDDESQKYAAIIMMDERSFAVEVGDVVGDRKIYRITSDRIYMESEKFYYFYDISGKSGQKEK